MLERVSGEANWVTLCGMEHTHIIMLADSTLTITYLKYMLVFMCVLVVSMIIVGIYNIKSNERTKVEEERTRQKTIEAVSEGKLSMDDAERLLKREKQRKRIP